MAAEAKGALRHNQEPSLLILLFALSQEIDTPWILVLRLVFFTVWVQGEVALLRDCPRPLISLWQR